MGQIVKKKQVRRVVNESRMGQLGANCEQGEGLLQGPRVGFECFLGTWNILASRAFTSP